MVEGPIKIDWREAASALSRRVDGAAFEPEVIAHLHESKRLLVACSGGADSVYLLCLLAERAAEFNYQLHVAHYNHRWRGQASASDAAFVEDLSAALSLPFISDARPSNEAAFTETTARALRLEFLRKAARHFECEAIAYGHQLDDVIETQLQRIARGCGSEGLAAPRPVALFEQDPKHLRPLLHLRAGHIRMTLNSLGIPWCEDGSNDELSIARNALRRQIIPDLANALGRDPALGAARSRSLLEEDAAALDSLARQQMPEAFRGAAKLSRASLRNMPPALLRRALTAWMSGHGLIDSVGASAMDLLMEILQSRRKEYRMSAGTHFITLDAETLAWSEEVTKDDDEVLQATRLEPGEPVFLSTGALIEAEVVELSPALFECIRSGRVDPEREAIVADPGEGSYQLRAYRPDDRFHPMGAPGSKKLKDCLIDRKIPRSERKRLPLVLNASQQVIWIPGWPPAEFCKIVPGTKKALRLTYQARNPL